jgi:hypothetical protein
VAIQISEGLRDEPPGKVDDPPTTDSTEHTGWFNPDFPHSTEQHPYGYFLDGDGNPDFSRPRIRRPRGYGKSSSSGSSVARSQQADGTAKTAAKMLTRINGLVALSLTSFGMPISGNQIKDANTVFEEMAYEALQTDPVLARKILSAGASSGKAQLTMAYIMLAGSVAPIAYGEIREKRLNSIQEVDSNESDDIGG